MREKNILRRCTVALGLGLMVLGGCEKKQESQFGRKETEVPVRLRAVKVIAVQREVEVVGTLWADEDTMVASKIAGRVVGVYKDIGDRVKTDELLVLVSPIDYELARKQKEFSAREPLAKLGLSELPKGEFDLTKVPTVVRTKLQADNAESKYNRGKQLHDQTPPLLSDQDFADLKTTFEVAKSAYDVELLTAQFSYAQAQSLQADVAVASQRLADTRINAPSAEAAANGQPGGRPRSFAVAAKMVSVGEYLKEGASVFRLIDDDVVKLRASVPERFVRELELDHQVRVKVEAYTEDFIGKVSRINPQVDPANRMFQIEVLIANPKHQLKPGSFAKGWVQTRVEPRVVFVPTEAVVAFAGTSKVFTIAGNKAVEKVVELGDRREDFIEAVKGLSGNEQVVVVGASKLASGVGVVLMKDEPTTAPAGGKPVAAPVTTPEAKP